MINALFENIFPRRTAMLPTATQRGMLEDALWRLQCQPLGADLYRQMQALGVKIEIDVTHGGDRSMRHIGACYLTDSRKIQLFPAALGDDTVSGWARPAILAHEIVHAIQHAQQDAVGATDSLGIMADIAALRHAEFAAQSYAIEVAWDGAGFRDVETHPSMAVYAPMFAAFQRAAKIPDSVRNGHARAAAHMAGFSHEMTGLMTHYAAQIIELYDKSPNMPKMTDKHGGASVASTLLLAEIAPYPNHLDILVQQGEKLLGWPFTAIDERCQRRIDKMTQRLHYPQQKPV